MTRKLAAALLLFLCLVHPASARAPERWGFAVVSDIHVYPDGRVAARFKTLVDRLVDLKPRFVVIAGDSTNGNKDDRHSLSTARMWWRSLHSALEPLKQARVPLLPIAGNHDSYRQVHRDAYEEAWRGLASQPMELELKGDPAMNYSFDLDGVHFSLLRVVDQKLDSDVAAWLKADLEDAAGARLRFAFGHVPLESRMGRTSETFKRKLGKALAEGNADAYFAGHEHLVFDAPVDTGAGTVRQVTVGTASATYTYGLNERTYREWCKGSSCRMPSTGRQFEVDPSTRKQLRKLAFVWVDLTEEGFSPRALALDEAGRIVAFDR